MVSSLQAAVCLVRVVWLAGMTDNHYSDRLCSGGASHSDAIGGLQQNTPSVPTPPGPLRLEDHLLHQHYGLTLTEQAGPGRGVVCIREFDGTKRTKRKKRELRSPDGAPFVSVAFSNDGKLVLTQGGAPQWQLTLWSWEKAKVIASVRTTTERDASVRRADFNPFDSSLICASGVGLVKFFRVTESALRPMLNTLVKQSAQNFTGHAWLPHGMIIATTDLGEIVLFNDCELAGEVATAAEVGAIDSVVTTSKGFLISEEYGTVRIYQRVVDDDEGGEGGEGAAAAAAAAQHGGAAAPSGDRYEERRIISPFNSGVPAPMKNMAISPAGDTVAVVCSDHQIYSLKLANAEFAPVQMPETSG